MSHGFQVWDASGALQLDISDRITRVHSMHPLYTNYIGSFTVSVPGFSIGDSSWLFYVDNSMFGVTVSGSVFTISSYTSVVTDGFLIVFRV